MQDQTAPTTISYGHVSFKRVIADGDHGNIQVERSIPILLDLGRPTTPDMIQEAEQAAWETAVEQVNEQVNAAFEREDNPAPIYTGARYKVGLWTPDDSLLLIIPADADVPGGVHWLTYGPGHRLPKAREIADRLLAKRACYTDCWDFHDGDFTELKFHLGELEKRAAELNGAEGDPDADVETWDHPGDDLDGEGNPEF